MRSSASLVVFGLLLGSCAVGPEARPAAAVVAHATPPLPYGTYQASGLASWYGDEVAGNFTASGDLFDPEGVTAAHRTLPLGSYVEVTALDTGRSILVRINDRGPGRKERLIDLSHGAARLLGTDRHALSQVRVRALSQAPTGRGLVLSEGHTNVDATRSANLASLARSAAPTGPGPFFLQVASFSNKSRARKLAGVLGGDMLPDGAVFRVRMGPFAAGAVQQARDAVARRGYGDAQILPVN